MEEVINKTDQEIWDSIEMNGLTKWLLVIMIVTSSISMFSQFVTNMMWSKYGLGTYQLIGAIINLTAFVLILKKNKWGAIIYISMMFLQIPLNIIFVGGRMETIWLSAIIRIVVLSVLLALPKNGITGWKLLFCKEEVIRMTRESFVENNIEN